MNVAHTNSNDMFKTSHMDDRPSFKNIYPVLCVDEVMYDIQILKATHTDKKVLLL